MVVAMKCHQAHKNIYLFDELSDKDRRALLKHVEECQQCAELFESVKEMGSITKRAGQVVAEPIDSYRLTNKIMAGVIAESNRPRGWYEVLMSYMERSEVTWAMVAGSIFLISVFVTQFPINGGDSFAKNNNTPSIQKAVILNVSSFKEVLNERNKVSKRSSRANCEDPFTTSVKCIKEKIERLRSINNNGK